MRLFDTFMNRLRLTPVPFQSYEKYIERLRRIPGIDVVSPQFNSRQVCYDYIFGIDGDGSSLARLLMYSLTFDYRQEQGKLIFYYSGGRVSHTGIVENDGRIRSKWGRGPVVRHAIWSVPLGYGSRVNYSNAPSENEIAAAKNRSHNFIVPLLSK